MSGEKTSPSKVNPALEVAKACFDGSLGSQIFIDEKQYQPSAAEKDLCARTEISKAAKGLSDVQLDTMVSDAKKAYTPTTPPTTHKRR